MTPPAKAERSALNALTSVVIVGDSHETLLCRAQSKCANRDQKPQRAQICLAFVPPNLEKGLEGKRLVCCRESLDMHQVPPKRSTVPYACQLAKTQNWRSSRRRHSKPSIPYRLSRLRIIDSKSPWLFVMVGVLCMDVLVFVSSSWRLHVSRSHDVRVTFPVSGFGAMFGELPKKWLNFFGTTVKYKNSRVRSLKKALRKQNREWQTQITSRRNSTPPYSYISVCSASS